MDSISVNWEALDSLVIDFSKSEYVIEDSVSSPSSPSSSSYHSRLLICQIRRLVEIGDVDAAIDLLRAHAPFVLMITDFCSSYRSRNFVKKFIELVRRGTEEDCDSAINCLRRDSGAEVSSFASTAGVLNSFPWALLIISF